MRNLRWLLCMAFCLGSLTAGTRVAARVVVPDVHSLLLGDRDCGDDTDCAYPATTVDRLYLHVVVHDLPGNDDWRVQAAPYCSAAMPDVAGGGAIPASGYLESVVDLSAVVVSAGRPTVCIVIRGRKHWAVTYYAAYLDDSPEPDAGTVYPDYPSANGAPDLPDLDVTYIHRSPAYPFDAAKNDPHTGDPVTFTAHIQNAGYRPSLVTPYRWTLGARVLGEGEIPPLEPGQDMSFDIGWRWETGPHEVKFSIDPTTQEISKGNNSVTIRTDALSLGFWVERGAYDYFKRWQWKYCRDNPCSGSDSLQDWLQRQVKAWNHLLAGSTHRNSPAGILERFRLDEVTVVPDGALPLHGGLATNTPDAPDHSVDLEWGLPSAGVTTAYPHNWEGPFDVDWGLIHELSHARSLVDLYRFDIPIPGDSSIDVHGMDGQPVFDSGNPLDAQRKIRAFVTDTGQEFLYQNHERDLMSCTCTPGYSEYSAMVLNRLGLRRAVCGNSNPPCNLGDWLDDIPPVNRIRIVDSNGDAIPDGSEVKTFFDLSDGYTSHSFRQDAVRSFRVSGGTIQLGPDPFLTGTSRWQPGHNLLLVEVAAGGQDDFCFLEPTQFNTAYWLGYRDAVHAATYTLRVGAEVRNGCNLQLPPGLVNEPFATSPYASAVTSRTRSRNRAAMALDITVRLDDGSSPARPMRARVVHAVSAKGMMLGSATTNERGIAHMTLQPPAASIRIVDVTDNNLPIGPD